MADCCCGVFRHEPGCPAEDRLVDLTAHVDAGPSGDIYFRDREV